MRVKIFHHDHCFDGAASAAFFTRFLSATSASGADFSYSGLTHKAKNQFDPAQLDADLHAVVDFKYWSDPRVDWWFDHHQSAFLTPADQLHFQGDTSGTKFFDPSYKSCTLFIRDITLQKFGFEAPDLAELVKWATIIDGAQYSDAKTAVELAAPAMKLVLVIEGAKGSDMVHQIIGWMGSRTLDEIVADPGVRAVFDPLYERHLRSIDVIRERGVLSKGVLFFDIVGMEAEGYNKFIPYYLFPETVYTVSVSQSTVRTKISVGSNPWAPAEPSHNLASICERYGGGGHPRVGAISYEVDELDRARRVAADIVEELKG